LQGAKLNAGTNIPQIFAPKLQKPAAPSAFICVHLWLKFELRPFSTNPGLLTCQFAGLRRAFARRTTIHQTAFCKLARSNNNEIF
jgi:hypothetical protein